MRSAKPPMTSAGVMTAKVIWNMKNTLSGTVPVTDVARDAARGRPCRAPPMKPCAAPPSLKVNE